MRTVNTEPLPGSLSAVMSPPIIWQKRLLIASPSPVPPYLRVVEASAWENSWNSLPICSAVADAGVSNCDGDPSAVVLLPLTRVNGDGAVVGELVGVAQEVQE